MGSRASTGGSGLRMEEREGGADHDQSGQVNPMADGWGRASDEVSPRPEKDRFRVVEVGNKGRIPSVGENHAPYRNDPKDHGRTASICGSDSSWACSEQ